MMGKPLLRELAQLKQPAEKLGLVIQPLQSFQKLFAESVTNRLKMRERVFVYQSAAYHLNNFPREAAASLFPPPTADGGDSERADLEARHGPAAYAVHGRPVAVACCKHGWSVACAIEAVRAVCPRAGDTDAAHGGVSSQDGEGAREAVRRPHVDAVRRGGLVASSQRRRAAQAGI
eukprot:3530125-Pleurochrysis_carterae.AAC.1